MDKRILSGCIASLLTLMLFALISFMFGARLHHVQATPWGELPLLDVAGVFAAAFVGGAIGGARFWWFALGLVTLLWALVLFVMVTVQPEMTLAKVWRFNQLAIVLNLVLAWLGAFLGAQVGARFGARRAAG
ncbi:hypothetical protein JI752_014535 [Lysobacter sp. MMG2]|uniref:hypothetical protein n=1 Tax=Lysobacter sp. MMG2 TaxID=2801338 RepID=UPI001C221BB8|nr:hypothetical protein [Lysobacter sp. MMG2]MBU8977365.1 hypothetical protein [Lysobacter sp. MMG2]